MTRSQQVRCPFPPLVCISPFLHATVDAHVGKALFANAILGALKARGKTVLLVTHALHFLPQVDYVYTLVNGRVVERGSYDDLIQRDGPFSRLVTEFGGGGSEEEMENARGEDDTEKRRGKVSYETLATAGGTGKVEGRLMKAEKRTIGSVSMQGPSFVGHAFTRDVKIFRFSLYVVPQRGEGDLYGASDCCYRGFDAG
jgi:hypothetical protein